MLTPLLALFRDPRATVAGAVRSPTVRTFLVSALVLGLGLVSGVQLARWMGPSGRGELAAAWLWPMLLMYLASMGVIQAVVYFAARADAAPGRVLGTALACAGVQSVLAMAVGYVVLPLLLARQSAAVIADGRAYLWVIPVSLMSQYGLGVLQARLRFAAFNWIRLLNPAGYVVAVLALAQARALTVSHALEAQLGLNVVVLVATAVALWQTGTVGGLGDLRPDRALVGPMLRYGAKVQAGGIPQIANLRMDQALLAAWFPPVQLGLYVAAVSAAGVGDVLSTAVRTVATPSIAQQGAAAGARTLAATFRKYIVVSVAGTLLLALVLPWAIPFVYGAAFAGAVPPALVLLGAGLCLGAKQVLAGGAQALGDPWLASRSEILGAVVTVAALPLLLPRLGIMGGGARDVRGVRDAARRRARRTVADARDPGALTRLGVVRDARSRLTSQRTFGFYSFQLDSAPHASPTSDAAAASRVQEVCLAPDAVALDAVVCDAAGHGRDRDEEPARVRAAGDPVGARAGAGGRGAGVRRRVDRRDAGDDPGGVPDGGAACSRAVGGHRGAADAGDDAGGRPDRRVHR